MISDVAAATAVEQFLSGYKQFLDFIEIGGANHGQVVEQILKHCGLEAGEPWCMATASYVGYRAFMRVDPTTKKRTSLWPLLNSGSVAAVAADANKRGVLMTKPQRGDVFVKYYPSLKRFAHAGVVDTVVKGLTCVTFDGNTTCDAGDPYAPVRPANAVQDDREGWGEFVKLRTFSAQDRFIRWTGLLE